MSRGAGAVTEDDVVDESMAAEVLLDENELAEGHPGFNLGAFEVRAVPSCCTKFLSRLPLSYQGMRESLSQYW